MACAADVPGKQDKSIISEHLNCPVCLEVYKEPRSLACMHTFCQPCMDSVIRKNADKWKEGNKIICPVCRYGTAAPPNAKCCDDWAKCLPINYALLPLLDTIDKDKDKARACDSCAAEDEICDAIAYCVQCNAYQCKRCVKNHSKYPVMKKHSIKELDELTSDTDGAFSLGTLEFCEVHNKRIKYICDDHTALCCSTCMFMSHRKCGQVIGVSEFRKKINEEKKVEDMRSKTNDLRNEVEDMNAKLGSNANAIQTQANSAKEKLLNMKRKVMKKLELIFNQATDQCDKLRKEFESSFEDRISSNRSLAAAIISSRSMLDSVLEHGKEAQISIAFVKVQEQYNRYVEILQKNQQTTAIVELELEVDDVLNEVANSFTFAARISVRKTFPKPINTYEARIVKTCEMKKEKDMEIPSIGGVAYLEDGQIVMADTNNLLCCFLDENLNITSDIEVPGSPIGLSVTSSNTVIAMVQNNDTFTFQFLSVGDTPKVTRAIDCSRVPVAVAPVNESKLAVGWGTGVGVISLEDGREIVYLEKDTTEREIKFEQHDFLAVDINRYRFYQTSDKQSALYCTTFNGIPVFTYTNRKLKEPSGVALDRDGNACVCSWATNNVHQVSPNGNLLRILQVGLVGPYSICFSTDGEKMFVVAQTGDTIPKLSCVKVIYSG